jgi:hypothetical protein
MKNNKLILLFFIAVLVTHCGIIIISPPGRYENAADFKVNPETKPSELLNSYLGDEITHPENNYYLIFFDIYCAPPYNHYFYCNSLYKRTQNNMKWLAVTLYDSLEHYKWRKKLDISNDSLIYAFPTYYGIHGLKASMRNLYYNNSIPDSDISTMIFIVINDSIKYYFRMVIHTRERYLEQRQLLDSLFSNKTIPEQNSPLIPEQSSPPIQD